MAQRTISKINDKQAATVGLTFSAMDPKRGDGKMYDLIFEPTVDGEIETKSSAASVDWSV